VELQPVSSPLQRVLIVDDDTLFRRVRRTFLDEDGRFSVVGEAGTGLEALPLIELLHPDAVLLDFDMPLMDGLATCIVMEERWPEVRVVMLTGTLLDEQEAAEIAAHHVPFLMRKDRFEARSVLDALVGPMH
jgi:DNA-binding NarL/FixJ family response regulator